MKLRYSLAAAALLLAAAPQASAQQVVQQISLADKETLGGTVRLANRQTVLLMSSGDAPEVRVLALNPDGQTAWQTKLMKVQQVSRGSRSLFESADEAERREARASQLAPINVYTTGNDLYAVEVISENVAKTAGKTSGLTAGQVIVQHVDERGEVQRASFPAPERNKKTERTELGHYGDGNMYYVLAHEFNPRSEVTEYVVERHNLAKGGAVERSVLSLPAAPERGMLNRYHNEWFYLGHRPGQTYLARRLASHSKQERPLQKSPLEFEVLVLDNAGQRLGGFTSTMNLPQGNWVAYSTYYMPNLLEQKHRYVPLTSGKVIYDEFKLTTGGYGDFYLDYETGQCLIFGEYTTDHLPLVGDNSPLEGFFMRSFDPLTGTVVRQSQYAYPKELKQSAGKLLASSTGRACWFSVDPLSGQSEVTFTAGGAFSAGKRYVQFQYDPQLAHLAHQERTLTDRDWKEHKAMTHLTIARPVCLRKSNGDSEEFRYLFQAEAHDAPVYGAVRKMHLAAVGQHPDAQYILSGTGEGRGLLLEQMDMLGGKVTVYAF